MDVALQPNAGSSAMTRSPVVDLAICMSAYAALAHAVVVRSHFAIWPAAGWFFVLLTVAQGVFAVLLVRDRMSPMQVAAGVWGTAAVICVYIISRTNGIPFAPRVSAHGGAAVPGQSLLPRGPESIGPLDISTLVAELVLIVALLSVMDRRMRNVTTNGLVALGLLFWGLAATGLLS
jgi:ABC-type thiamin/hydroxymethylpyrimidine transport system permease subunit